MIFSIGTDVVQIPRIEKIFSIYGDKFAKKILSFNEMEKFTSLDTTMMKCRFLSKVFSVKESFSKAFGTGIGEYIRFTEIDLRHNDLGKPFIHVDNIYNKFVAMKYIESNQYNKINIHVSLSDDYPVIVSFVIIELL
jgi:holo-[acyl-carrier protein] synthase